MAELPGAVRSNPTDAPPVSSSPSWDDYEAERVETVRRHAPFTLFVLLTFVFTFAVFEWQRRPQNRTILVLADSIFVLISLAAVMAARARPQFTMAIVIVSINAYVANMQLYETLARGSNEMTVIGTTLLLGGVVATLPLGVRNLLLSSVFAIGAFPVTMALGARNQLDPFFILSVLVACITAMAAGAGTIDRYRRRILQQSAEQAQLAATNARLVAEAQAAHEAKSEFLATVAHELRSPLGAIVGYGDLLRDGVLTDPAAIDEAHRHIVDQGVEMLDMVQNLLDADKAGSGTMRLELGEVELRQFLVNLREELPLSWDKPGVVIAWNLPSEPVHVTSDARKLKAILRNLLHNAIKYTPRGQVTVAAVESTDGVELSVADTGEGIPAADLPFIFERFRQSGNPTRGGGVGLGLHIVKCFTEALGGRLTAESEFGKGSRFVVHLPRASS